MSVISLDKITPSMVTVYTDGACGSNGSKNAVGGIGVYIPHTQTKFSYKVSEATNNKCELLAILYALYTLRHISNPICIISDSEYCIKSICVWYDGWQKKGKEYANKLLIDTIHEFTLHHKVYFSHVRAHTNKTDIHSLNNQIVDELATSATEPFDESIIGKLNDTPTTTKLPENEIVTKPTKRKNKTTTIDDFFDAY